LRVRLKSVLSEADYLAVLNQRLRAHPMYLEGMAFPVASDDETGLKDDDETEVEKLPLVELVLDTQWDRFGVFASVIDDVHRSYELASAIASQNPVPGCQRLASQAVKSRRQRV
jgi:hypothetical protein